MPSLKGNFKDHTLRARFHKSNAGSLSNSISVDTFFLQTRAYATVVLKNGKDFLSTFAQTLIPGLTASPTAPHEGKETLSHLFVATTEGNARFLMPATAHETL